MPLSKDQKKKIIEDVKDKISRQKAVIFTDIKGLKVKDLTVLRKELNKEGIDYKMVKKTLLKISLPKGDIADFNPKDMKGEVVAAFGYKDEVAPARILYKFSKTNENLKIVGGIVGGKIFQKEQVIALANLPSREVLLAKLVGSIASPLSGFVNVLQGNLRGLVYVLSAIKKTE
jgi:large subunit ribosomal protein L10